MANSLTPTLAVRDAAAAIDFYVRALGATELSRFTGPEGQIVHADLRAGAALFAVKEADGTDTAPGRQVPVVLGLDVDDADAAWAALREAGAGEIFPLGDHEYGYRQGRVADPYGHQWIVSQRIEDLSTAEAQRRMDAGYGG
ncbi:MAG: VOC family protein [Actinocatenispora sp.]